MFKNKRVLLFDFETTGLNAAYEQIIEIGAIVLELRNGKYEIIEELSTLVEAQKPLSPKIIEITHITDEMLLRDGIPESVAFQKLFDMYQDENTLLIAYNILFDLSFLQALFRKYYQPQFEIKNDILDVMAIYKDRHRYPHRLESAVQTYQVNIKNTHRALDDIKATYEVIKALQVEQPNIKHYVNKIGFNPKYGIKGQKMPHVQYIAQYGGRREIEKSV
ncbi:3'-5' exonuclease [Mycoplasmatota bacterium]|nr:3'-5' exonuclease [Mycoplasmatota bacterium]